MRTELGCRTSAPTCCCMQGLVNGDLIAGLGRDRPAKGKAARADHRHLVPSETGTAGVGIILPVGHKALQWPMPTLVSPLMPPVHNPLGIWVSWAQPGRTAGCWKRKAPDTAPTLAAT